MKIKYNLKKILIEEDDIDLVDTSFQDKWDKVPDWGNPNDDPNPDWEEYHDDLFGHVKDRVTSHAKYNPDELTGLPSVAAYLDKQYKQPGVTHAWKTRQAQEFGEAAFWADEYMDNWYPDSGLNYQSSNHMQNSRAEPWTKNFNQFLKYIRQETLKAGDSYYGGHYTYDD